MTPPRSQMVRDMQRCRDSLLAIVSDYGPPFAADCEELADALDSYASHAEDDFFDPDAQTGAMDDD